MIKALVGENAFQILLLLLDGDKQFNQIMKAGKKGSFANELRELLKQRYIERKLVDSKPPKSIYKITKLGKDFLRNLKDERITKLKLELKRLNMLD